MPEEINYFSVVGTYRQFMSASKQYTGNFEGTIISNGERIIGTLHDPNGQSAIYGVSDIISRNQSIKLNKIYPSGLNFVYQFQGRRGILLGLFPNGNDSVDTWGISLMKLVGLKDLKGRMAPKRIEHVSENEFVKQRQLEYNQIVDALVKEDLEGLPKHDFFQYHFDNFGPFSHRRIKKIIQDSIERSRGKTPKGIQGIFSETLRGINIED